MKDSGTIMSSLFYFVNYIFIYIRTVADCLNTVLVVVFSFVSCSLTVAVLQHISCCLLFTGSWCFCSLHVDLMSAFLSFV